jgi:hypothetical protein
MVRLFTEILTSIPPPPLVDAICLVIASALHQNKQIDKIHYVVVREQINEPHAAEVCTPFLAKALCNLVALGQDYTSSAVFSSLKKRNRK